jgi:hypothetical protein
MKSIGERAIRVLRKAALPLFFGSTMALASTAQAGCWLVIEGLGYQAVKCDGYTPFITEGAAAWEFVRKQITNQQCFSGMTNFIAADVACIGELGATAAAIVGAYGELAAAAGVASAINIANDQYVIVSDSTKSTSVACGQLMDKMADWLGQPACGPVRPALPQGFGKVKPARTEYVGGTEYIVPLGQGGQRFPLNGKVYNEATDTCDYYINGAVKSSLPFNGCPQFNVGTVYHWELRSRLCSKYVDGLWNDNVAPYMCGSKYDNFERIASVGLGACAKLNNGKVAFYLNDSACAGLNRYDSYVWKDSTCWYYVNGKTSSIVDKSKCGIAETPANVTYRWSDELHYNTCRKYVNGAFDQVVENSYCGRPARNVEVNEYACTISINGRYERTLSRGEEDCPPSAGSGTPEPIPVAVPVPDNDGRVPMPLAPSGWALCQRADSDPDGDGWGFENGIQCQMEATLIPPPPPVMPL